ncbi:MAG: hypothetical protein U0T69_04070 [Chitinophagales bacterium]
MTFLNFLFYKSYRLALFLGNKDFYPEGVAWFLTTLLPWLNFISVLIILKNQCIITNSLFGILLDITFVYWIYTLFLFIYEGKYKMIIKEQEELEVKRKYSNILFYTYLLITGVIYFGFLGN